MQITKDMTVMDILAIDPNTANIFMQLGMHCIYCEAASGETVEEALAVHGYMGKDVPEIVEEINKFVQADLAAQKNETAETETAAAQQ